MHPMVNIALRAARKAGDIIVRASDRIDTVQVESKGVNDFVTEVDRAAEQEIISHLRKAYPTHAIRGEESGELPGKDEGADYQWIIDPLDGTTNFTRGIPHYAVSIGCFYKGRPEHAVIYDPVRQEEFTATRGAGAQINGRRMRVSSRNNLDGALLATGIPFRSRQQTHLDAYLNTLRSFSNGTAGIRRAGAASLDLAYVAAGRVDGFWEIGLSPWDIAAGALLVLEAGGLIGDFNGGNEYMTSGNVVCANPKCFKAMLQVIKPHLGHIS